MKQYGFFSETYHEMKPRDHAIWLTPEGKEVEVHYVTEDPEGKDFVWKDKWFRGEVVGCVKMAPQLLSRFTI